MVLFGFDGNGNPAPMGETQAKVDFAHEVQELADLILMNTTLMPLRNPVSLDRSGYMVQNADGTSTELGRVAFAFPVAYKNLPEGLSDKEKFVATLDSIQNEPILALVTSTGSDGINQGHAFYFNFYGEIVGYSKGQVTGNGINSIDMAHEVLKCPANYVGPAKTLLLEAAAKIKEKHQLASELEAGLNIGKEESVNNQQTYQTPILPQPSVGTTSEQTYPVPQDSPILPQPLLGTTRETLTTSTSVPEMPAQSNAAKYVGISTGAVLGAILLAYVAKRLYNQKK